MNVGFKVENKSDDLYILIYCLIKTSIVYPNYQDIFIFLTILIIVLKPATWAHNLVTDELGGMGEELKTS